MTDALEHAFRDGPRDVEATVRWLLGLGFTETAAWYSESAFGNLAITFARDGDEITVTRDRAQWALELRLAGWKHCFGLDIILDQINGREDWTPQSDALPELLPPGVSWSEVVPEALSWAEQTADAEALLDEKLRQRARSRFPSR